MRSRTPRELSEAKTLALLEKFKEWGWDHPRMPWQDVLRGLGSAYGLVTRDLKPIDEEATLILGKAKRAFRDGARLADIDNLGVRRSLPVLAKSPRKADPTNGKKAEAAKVEAALGQKVSTLNSCGPPGNWITCLGHRKPILTHGNRDWAAMGFIHGDAA